MSQGDQQGCHISHGGSPQHLAGTPKLIVLQQMGALQAGNGPAGGVELHRQRYKLEHHRRGKQQHAHAEQGLGVEQQADDDQNQGELGADIADGHQGGTQLNGAIPHRVLHRMARLVGGHSHRRDAVGAVHRVGQADDIAPGIVVVGQPAGDPLNAHILNAVGPQYCFRRLGAGKAPAAGHTGVTVEGGGHIELGQQGDQHGRYQDHPVIGVIIVEKRHGIPPFT